MKRRSTRNNRKNNPLAIELRDFLMYSNPSKFAPRIRQTGGEAFPQAPTMNQFFNYGAPTPKTPFVFQDGGAMNDIQKMNMQYMQHYGKMQDGGSSMDMGSEKSTRVADFLRKVKEKAMSTMEEELMNEASEYENELINMFQYGGFTGPQPDFTKANAWMDAYKNNANVGKLQDNFLTLAEEWAGTPDDVYVKKIKTKQMPIAQMGRNVRNQADVPFEYINPTRDRSSISPYPNTEYIPSSPTIDRSSLSPYPDNEYMPDLGTTAQVDNRNIGNYVPGIPSLGLTTQNPSYNQNILSEDIPGMGPSINSQLDFRKKMQSLSPFPEGDEEYLPVPTDPNATPKKVDTSIINRIPTSPPIKSKDATRIPGEDGSAAQSLVEKSLEDIAKKREEEESNSDCPGGNCGKPGSSSKTGSSQTPQAGSEEEKDEAAAAGMTPAEYRTFLSRMSINKRRAILPGNRAKSIDFYFNTYGPSGNLLDGGLQSPNSVTASANEETTQDNQSRGSFGDGEKPGSKRKSNRNILADMLARRENYREGQTDLNENTLEAQRQLPAGSSKFDPRGYNSAYSDLRNQVFQNRKNRLGERLDNLLAKQNELRKQYGQDISQEEYDRINRLTERYNTIGEGRTPVMDQPIGPENAAFEYQHKLPVNSYKGFGEDYNAPRFEYGGYFQYGGQDDPFGTAGYSMDGYDTTEREDYAGNTIYEEAPAGMQDDELKGTTRVRQKLDYYNPYEAPTLIAAMDLSAGLINKRKNRKKNLFGKMSADQVFTEMDNNDRGNATVNEGYVGVGQQVPVENTGYNFKSLYARYGGSYKKGGEYYLSDEEIQEIINMGGQVEYLD